MSEFFEVPEGVKNERADKWLAGLFPDRSRSQWQKMLDAGCVRNEVTGTALTRKTAISAGDKLRVEIPEESRPGVVPVEIPLDVLFEDEDLIVINKSAGMVTHPGAGTADDTLVHALLHHTGGKLAMAGGELRPGVVHRLDKETSGLIVFAKSDFAYHAMVEKFAEREIHKEYIALVDKAPDLLAGSIKAPIDRDPNNRVKMAIREEGKSAWTDWFVLEKFGKDAALVRCVLHTGRTHQIRVHLAHIGHPILGDRVYGKVVHRHEGWPLPRVMLHAWHLKFEHPVSGQMLDLTAFPPTDFSNLATFLREKFGSRITGY
ncbi:MAG: RluA family pseudouridine synthase [Opitutales bacterium]|nr:RluA family pseudouridine synthase [Opitutales bacterium]